jgi:hypothetical protein
MFPGATTGPTCVGVDPATRAVIIPIPARAMNTEIVGVELATNPDFLESAKRPLARNVQTKTVLFMNCFAWGSLS